MSEDEVTIIGAGPAGIAAAIYLQRAKLEPVLIERHESGGLLRSANWVENYPGFPEGICGLDLVAKFKDQMKQLGIRPMLGEVLSVRRMRRGFELRLGSSRRTSRALIVATGTRPAKIGIKGAAGLQGKLVFSELPDLPQALKSRRVIVVGGGDAAFDYSMNLLARGARPIIVSRSEPSGLELLRERTEALGVELVIGATPKKVGRSRQGVIMTCMAGSTELEIEGDMMLAACGRVPNIEVLGPTLRGAAGPGPSGLPETKVKGLYLAGDIVRSKQRQTGIAVGDGIRAAMLAEQYLRGR